jgi:hypothetical protein
MRTLRHPHIIKLCFFCVHRMVLQAYKLTIFFDIQIRSHLNTDRHHLRPRICSR